MGCAQEQEHTYRLENLDRKVEKIEESCQESGKRMEKIDEAVKSAHKRVDEIGGIPQAVLKMSIAVENMASEIKEIATSMKDHQEQINERVAILEKQPAESAFNLQRQILGYVVAIVVAYVLGKFGVK